MWMGAPCDPLGMKIIAIMGLDLAFGQIDIRDIRDIRDQRYQRLEILDIRDIRDILIFKKAIANLNSAVAAGSCHP